ncbi:AAA family ATPase [bacterium]|nr:AAA family ATPase [bacterium]
MRKRILLPRIEFFNLVGFQPIFTEDVSMVLDNGPNVILGGNGLGKTTIMQAVTYGLTGGTSIIEDEEKQHKWDYKYFHHRLNKSDFSTAYVEVAFTFGDKVFNIRRGFKSSRIIAFREDNLEWINKHEPAHEAFLEAILHEGNYLSQEDFSFIVHRLLYLPESRRLLAWDSDAQVRTIMLLNQDLVSEHDFRKRKKEMKELDSNKRHIHVSIGKVKNKIKEQEKPKSKKSVHSYLS